MPLKNIVRALALMFATVLSAAAGDPPTLGTTELHAAAENNSSPAVFEVLLKAGADVNAKDRDGSTPLHMAAEFNPSPSVLEILLKASADPRALDTEGKTPHAVAKPENRDILWKAMMDKPLK